MLWAWMSIHSGWASPVVATAHPGHGSESWLSPWHYLIEPAHGGALLVLFAALAAYRLVRRANR